MSLDSLIAVAISNLISMFLIPLAFSCRMLNELPSLFCKGVRGVGGGVDCCCVKVMA